VVLSPSAYKYRGSAEGGKKKGGESWKDFLKEKVREIERERPTVFLERKRGETEREKQQGFSKKRVKRKGPKVETRGKKKAGEILTGKKGLGRNKQHHQET